MKNKKGFTLVELMAVIVVLAIIIAIAVPVYNKIKLNIDKKNYENKIELIEVAAAKYAEDTHYETMFVDDLIKAGYLDADDEKGLIYNNINKEIINCNIIQVENENGTYYAKFLEDKSALEKFEKETNNYSCDLNMKNEFANNIYIKMYNLDTAEQIKYNETSKWWTKSDVKLEVVLKEKEIKKVEWYEGYFQDPIKDENSNTLIIKTNSVLQQTYKAKVTDSDNNKYEAMVRVQIDKIEPNYYSDINKQISNEWLTVDGYKIKAYDNESGIHGYYVEYNDGNNLECPTTKDSYNAKRNQEFKKNGKYIICAMDNVGNIKMLAEEVEIDHIDVEGDICNIEVTGSYTNVDGKDWYYTDTYLTVTVISQHRNSEGNIIDEGALAEEIEVFNSNDSSTSKYKLENNKYKFQLNNTGTNNIIVKTKDSVGNIKEEACKISINLDNVQPKITAKDASQIIAYGANKTLLSLFNITTKYGPTGGTTTCYYIKNGSMVVATNNNQLQLGKNTIKCKMIGKNSKTSEATTIIYHTKTSTKFTCPSGYENTGTTCKKCTGTGNKVVKC